MEAFNRSVRAIAIGRERTAALMRNARPLPTSGINLDILNSSVGGLDPYSPIAEPQLLASAAYRPAMTPRCAPEPPASVLTTVGAYPMLQSYTTPSSVAQSTHGQRPAAHDPLSIPAQSQHWQVHSAAFAEPPSTFQQQSIQPSVAQLTHGQHPAAHDNRTAVTANLAAPPTNLAAQVPAQSQHWQASGLPTEGSHSTFQPYAMAPPVPVPVCGQLKVVHLAQADHQFLDQLQAIADKPPLQPISTYATNGASHPRSARGALCKAGF
jgi:hypothetical protein